MRAVRLTAEAEATLGGQIDYLLGQGAIAAAQALKDRVGSFLGDTLATYPRTGHYVRRRRLWETCIPGTRIVCWYVFDDAELVVITFWHTSQDRRR